MTDKEIYSIWAPPGKKWVDWVRPVPFVGVHRYSNTRGLFDFTMPVLDFLEEKYRDAAIIVDLPGAESVKAGLALAELGFRPIPIFNGTIQQQGSRATVDNQAVGTALMWGASKLVEIPIQEDAPPAFLLDSNRMHRFKMEVSLFDNSWDIYHQDMPSAKYFINSGVDKIVILGQSLSKDLKIMLYPFQKKHIQIFLTNGYESPKKIRIPRPLWQEID